MPSCQKEEFMSVDWKEIGLVALAGLIGGEVSLVYSLTVGNVPAIEPLPWGVFSYAFLGLAAGLFGVYLLAKTDTRHAIHCLMFAAACGMSWAPIFDGASALVQQNREKVLDAKVRVQVEAVRAVAAKLRTTPPDQLAPTTAVAVQQVESLLVAATETKDRRLALSVSSSVDEMATSLREVSKKAPLVSADALRDIRKAQSYTGFLQPISVWTTAFERGEGLIPSDLSKGGG